MKEWTKPEITPVVLEPEEDVLSYCHNTSGSPSTSYDCSSHVGSCWSRGGGH